MNSLPNYPIVKWVPFVIGVIVLIFLFQSSVRIIAPGERGVLIRLGSVQEGIFNEGLHFTIPLVDTIQTLNVRVQKEQVVAEASSKDLQDVYTTVALNYHLNGKEVTTFWREIGIDYRNTIIAPALQEAVKATTSKYTAEELITKRSEVKEHALLVINARLEDKHILVDEFSIVNFDFTKNFKEAIEAKVTAEQNALAAKNKLEQIKYESEQRVVTAKAEAEAIKIQAEAIQAQGGKEYVQLKAVEKWDGKLPQYNGGGSVPFVNIGQ
ncbi:MAG: prohibitin family protein [bacterium]